MKHILIVGCCFFLLWTDARSQDVTYLETPALPGDGVYAILRRYRVNTPCNRAQFLKINKFRRKNTLIVGQSYKLPIQVHRYNGRSIRTTLGRNDRPWAERIQAYNEAVLADSLRRRDYRRDSVLWVPHSYLDCDDDSLDLSERQPVRSAVASAGSTPQSEAEPDEPASGEGRGPFEIFGEGNEWVPVRGNELAGCVFYVVAGHGGPDPGAIGRYYSASLCEDEYAYDVSLRLTRNLIAHGALVYVIIRDPDDGIRDGEVLECDRDELCWGDQSIPINQKRRLNQRSETVNQLYHHNKSVGVTYQRLIVVHVDSENRNNRVDMFFYHREGDEVGQGLAQTMRSTLAEKYESYRPGRGYNGTVRDRDLHVLRETLPPAVFIELGNIRNSNDQARLVIEGNRQLVADWLLDGVLRSKAGE